MGEGKYQISLVQHCTKYKFFIRPAQISINTIVIKLNPLSKWKNDRELPVGWTLRIQKSTSQVEGEPSTASGQEDQVSSGNKAKSSPQMEVGSRASTRLDGQDSIMLDPCMSTHDTTGNVLRFLTEMRKQSDRMTSMEAREEHMEQMIKSQSQLIVTLQDTIQVVASRLELRTDMSRPPPQLPPQGAEALPAELPRVPQPLSSDPQGGARARLTARFPRAPEPAVSQPAARQPPVSQPPASYPAQQEKQPVLSRETLKCDTCGHLSTNERRMTNHIRNIHNTRHLPGSAPLTLLVGDSHLSSLNVREVEKGLGRGSRLVTPGVTRPAEDRAYCSSVLHLSGRGLATLRTR